MTFFLFSEEIEFFVLEIESTWIEWTKINFDSHQITLFASIVEWKRREFNFTIVVIKFLILMKL